MKVVHILISGKVQGVGFRKFIRHFSKKFGLVGWVSNTLNGAVEAEVSGEEKNIKKLVALCHKGPFLSVVEKIEVREEEKEFPYTEFIIRHD